MSRADFDVHIGAQKKSSLHIDLAIDAALTAPVTTMEPASGLPLPRLVSHRYRLYPVVDQIADKVCATMSTYNGRSSSREKDLIDLVVLAVTQQLSRRSLGVAIVTEARRRRMKPCTEFVLPREWGRAYAKMANSVPYCADFRTVDEARVLVARFIDPVLDGSASGQSWAPEQRDWIVAASGPSADPADTV